MVLSYNHPEITARCVESVLNFIPPENVGLIHNGSQSKWVEQHKNQFPEIHHWEYSENRGYSGGANRAFDQGFARWSWVFLLTNDTQLLSTIQLPSLPGLYSPLVFLRKESRIDFRMGGFDARRGKLWHHQERSQMETSVKRGIYSYAPGTALLLHQDVYRRVGGMDETCHTYWEDVDFGVRASRYGYAPQHWESLRVLHAGGKTTRKDAFYTSYLFQRNRRRISWRYCPWKWRPEWVLRWTWEKALLRRRARRHPQMTSRI